MGITISLKHKMMKHSEDNGFCNLNITELSNTFRRGTYCLFLMIEEIDLNLSLKTNLLKLKLTNNATNNN